MALGQPAPALAERAAAGLASAGRRANDRQNTRAALALLTRAVELLRPVRFDLALELEAAWASFDLDVRAAAQAADGVAERAEAAEDDSGAMLAHASTYLFRTYSGDRRAIAEQEALCLAAQPLEEERDDPRRLGMLWSLFAHAANWRWENDKAVVAAQQALRYYHLAGDSPSDMLRLCAWSLIQSPRPADEALRMLDEIAVDQPPGGTNLGRAALLAMLGRIDEAWQLAEAWSDHLHEVSGDSSVGYQYLEMIATIEGDRERACRFSAKAIAVAPPGSEGVMASARLLLARQLCYLGRFDEAEPWLREAQAVESGTGRQAQISKVEALLLAARGELERAESLARSAITVAETETEAVWFRSGAYEYLATVLERAGRIDEAREALERALSIMERKRCLPIARRLREQIDSLGRAQVSRSSDTPALSGRSRPSLSRPLGR